MREEQGEQRHDRDDEQRDLRARGDRDLGGEPHLPACAMTIAPPCSAALPTIATMTTAMKNSLRPTAVAKALERVDEDLADPGGRGGRDGERDERGRHRPRALAGSARARVLAAVAAEIPADDPR